MALLPPDLRRTLLRLRRRQPLHARARFALLGLVGILMVLTPLADVVQRQSQELQWLLGARASLQPMARAVDVQRGLLAHRPPAALVLGGRAESEPERRARQDEVDVAMGALTSTLVRGHYGPAIAEDADLRADWAALVSRIAARRMTADASNNAHRLLVEQVLQVMDLVAEARDAEASPLLAAAMREPVQLARAADALARLEEARRSHRDEAAIGVRIVLVGAVRAAGVADRAGTAPPALVQARAVGRAALAAYVAALDEGDSARSVRALALLSDGLDLWQSQSLAGLSSALDLAAEDTRERRLALLVLLGALASVQLMLGASLWRDLRSRDARLSGHAGDRAHGHGEAHDAGGDEGDADDGRHEGAESRQPTERLIRRLRGGAGSDPPRDPRHETPPSQL